MRTRELAKGIPPSVCAHSDVVHVADWEGDPTIPNGVNNFSYYECSDCGERFNKPPDDDPEDLCGLPTYLCDAMDGFTKEQAAAVDLLLDEDATIVGKLREYLRKNYDLGEQPLAAPVQLELWSQHD